MSTIQAAYLTGEETAPTGDGNITYTYTAATDTTDASYTATVTSVQSDTSKWTTDNSTTASIGGIKVTDGESWTVTVDSEGNLKVTTN